MRTNVIRLVHTADIHLDTCFASAGLPPGFGNRRRQSLRDVFESIVRHAGALPADALLIAGDVFEHDRVSRDTVAFLRATFAAIPHVPVFISPGNHDPYVASSPYATESWPSHVHVFTTPKWESVEVEGKALTVHGFGFDGPDPSSNPFGTLRIPADGRVHVAVAHGSAQGHQPPQKKAYATFEPAHAAADGLAYLALGHFHSTTRVEGAFKTTMYYCGAPEGRGFNEAGPLGFLEVGIGNGTVDVRSIRSCRAIYELHSIDCSAFASAQQLVDAIRALPRVDGLARLARISLTGACAEGMAQAIRGVHDAVRTDFEHIEVIDQTLPADDYEAIAREDTSLGTFVRAINAELADTIEPERRAFLERAREIGLAAYLGRELFVPALPDA